jgi:copper resistance protein C
MRPTMSAILVIGALTTYASAAFAHAHLASAVPPADATVQAPAEVAIRFTEAVEPRFSEIRVENSAGQRVDDSAPHSAGADAKRLIVGLKPLTAGVYKVTWHVTSVDTHKTDGAYQFTVKP